MIPEAGFTIRVYSVSRLRALLIIHKRLVFLLFMLASAGPISAQQISNLSNLAKAPSITRLTSAGKNYEPMWSPDGRHLAFESMRDGNLEIMTIAADGTGLKNVTSHPGRDTSVSWAPDGKHIAFVSDRSGKADIYVLDLTKQIPTELQR